MSVTGDLEALARIPAPTFAEEPRLEWLQERLARERGIRERDVAGNLIWRWGAGRPEVLVAAHVDTVFPLGTDLSPRWEGHDLVGPGVGDNAAAIAVTLTVVGELLRRDDVLPGAVAFTVGEEGLGNLAGATAACAHLAPRAFVAVEGHMLEAIVVDAVGSIRARVETRGPGGHSWSDRDRPSAIHALIELAQRIRGLHADDRPVNIGLITGGRSINTIADQAEMVIECRSLEQRALDRFSAALEDLEVPLPLELAVTVIGRRPGGSLARDSPLLRAAVDARRAAGLDVEFASASTDANAALDQGIPALCIGVARGSGMHSLDERIDARTLEQGARQLQLLLERLLLTAEI